MTNEQLCRKFEAMLIDHLSLRQVVLILREDQSRGLTRHDALQALETVRDQIRDDSLEDRLLEFMDIVSGFCSDELTIWE